MKLTFTKNFEVRRCLIITAGVLIIFILSSGKVNALNYYSISNGGNWTSTSTWTTNACGQTGNIGTYPNSDTDNVTICSSMIPSLPAGVTTIGSLTVNLGAVFNITNAATLKVKGAFTNNAGASVGGPGTLELDNGVSNTLGTITSTTLSLIVGDSAVHTNTTVVTSATSGLNLYSLTIHPGAKMTVNNTLSIYGTVFSNSGTFKDSISSVVFMGPCTISGSVKTVFSTININTGGAGDRINLNQHITVTGTLQLTKGNIRTNSYIVTANGGVNGSATTGWIHGNLRKPVTKGTNISKTFQVGSDTIYRPVTITFAKVNGADSVTANNTYNATNHPNLNTSSIDTTRDVKTYWTLSAGDSLVFTTATMTFNYAKSDIVGGADTSKFVVESYNGTYWTKWKNANTPTSTQLVTINEVTALGAFAIGDERLTYNVFYSKASGANNLEVLTNWGINTDGTGVNPLNFTNANQRFNIRNSASTTISADWFVAGPNSEVIDGDGINAVNFSTTSSFSLTGPISVSANATLTLVNAVVPTLDTLNAASTVNYAYTGYQTVQPAIYGNLQLTNGTKTDSASLEVLGALTLASSLSKFTVAAGTTRVAGMAQVSGASVSSGTTVEVKSIASRFTVQGGSDVIVKGILNINNGAIVNIGDTVNSVALVLQGNAVQVNLPDTGVTNSSLNVSGRFEDNSISGGSNHFFIHNHGTLNVGTNSVNDNANAVFQVDANATFMQDGGTIAIHSKNAGSGGDVLINMPANSKPITGGTFRFGAGATPSNTNFLCNSAVPFYNVTVNAANVPKVTLQNNDLVVDSILTLNGGNIITGNTLKVIVSADIIRNDSSWIDGNLQRIFPVTASTTFKYEIGDSFEYAPATLVIRNVNSGVVKVTGHIVATDANENIPTTNASGIDQTKKANRYWIMNEEGGSGAFGNYDITLDFTDCQPQGNTAAYVIMKYDPSSWASTTSTVVGTTITATGLTSFSDFETGYLLSTGIFPVAKDFDVHIFPNPANDHIIVRGNGNSANEVINIYDALGQNIYQSVTADKEFVINVSGLSPGVYFIRIQNESGNALRQFVKE